MPQHLFFVRRSTNSPQKAVVEKIFKKNDEQFENQQKKSYLCSPKILSKTCNKFIYNRIRLVKRELARVVR